MLIYIFYKVTEEAETVINFLSALLFFFVPVVKSNRAISANLDLGMLFLKKLCSFRIKSVIILGTSVPKLRDVIRAV